MKLILVLAGLVTIAIPVVAQQQSFTFDAGFKLGAPLNDPSSKTGLNSTFSQSRWTGGPTVEFHLIRGFSLEVDALYRTSRQNLSFPFALSQTTNPYTFSTSIKSNNWDFPLLLKKSFTIGSVHPFVSAGYQWSYERRDQSYLYTCSGLPGSCKPADSPFTPTGGQLKNSSVVHGPTAGAGIEFRTRYGTISPEFRFSRPIDNTPPENRFTALVGFTWGRHGK